MGGAHWTVVVPSRRGLNPPRSHPIPPDASVDPQDPPGSIRGSPPQGIPRTLKDLPRDVQGPLVTSRGPPKDLQGSQRRLEGRSRTSQGPPRTLQATPSTHQAPPMTPQANPRTPDDLPRTLAGPPMTCRWTTPQSGPVNYPQRKKCGRSDTLKALTHTTRTTKHTHTQTHTHTQKP